MRWDVEVHGFFRGTRGIIIFQASWSQANPVRTQSTVTTVRSKKNHVLTLVFRKSITSVTLISNWATFFLGRNHPFVFWLWLLSAAKLKNNTSTRCDSIWLGGVRCLKGVRVLSRKTSLKNSVSHGTVKDLQEEHRQMQNLETTSPTDANKASNN